MTDTVLNALASQWREQARMLEAHGAIQAAATCRLHAAELEDALHAVADTVLTLREAARESGYSTDRLRHMIASGEIKQAGRRGAPRVRRADLPRKKAPMNAQFDASKAAMRLLATE